MVCCAKTCFWTVRRSDLENEIHFPKCSILLSNSIGFRTLNFSKGFLDNGILTLVKYLLIKVVAPLGHEQLLCPLSSSDIFLKVMDQTRKWDPQINRDRGQLYLFNSCLLQIVSSSGIISRNNHTLWNDVTSWQGSLYSQLEVSLILSLIIVQDLLLYHKDLWFIYNIILCQAYIYIYLNNIGLLWWKHITLLSIDCIEI